MVWGSRWIMALATSLIGAVLIAVSIDEPLLLLGVIPLAIGSFFLQVGLLRRLMPVRMVENEEQYEDEEED